MKTANKLLRMTLLGALMTVQVSSFASPPHSARPARNQQLTSPDQVPEDLNRSDWSSIRAAYEKHRHAAFPVEGQTDTWQARNPGQQWQTIFDARGFLTQPDSPSTSPPLAPGNGVWN